MMSSSSIKLMSPDVGDDETAALKRVIESGWLGKGQETEQFETEFARHLGVDRQCVVSATSCSEALFHAVALLDLQAGDEVVLPSISFLAAAQAICAAGATPVFCDVDPHSLSARLQDI